MTGKSIRLSKFLNPNTKKGLIVPMDHGFTRGPLEGIENTEKIAEKIRLISPYSDGIILHKGMLERLGAIEGLFKNLGIMMHLNGMISLSSTASEKVMLSSVECGLTLGADAISVELVFNGETDANNIKTLSKLADEARHCGVPLLAMLVDGLVSQRPSEKIARLRHLIRSAYEVGVDAVKIPKVESEEIAKLILKDISDDVLIFIAGGIRCNETEIIEMLKMALTYGATGVCVGRNIFERHDSSLVQKLREILDNPKLVETDIYAWEKIRGQ